MKKKKSTKSNQQEEIVVGNYSDTFDQLHPFILEKSVYQKLKNLPNFYSDVNFEQLENPLTEVPEALIVINEMYSSDGGKFYIIKPTTNKIASKIENLRESKNCPLIFRESINWKEEKDGEKLDLIFQEAGLDFGKHKRRFNKNGCAIGVIKNVKKNTVYLDSDAYFDSCWNAEGKAKAKSPDEILKQVFKYAVVENGETPSSKDLKFQLEVEEMMKSRN